MFRKHLQNQRQSVHLRGSRLQDRPQLVYLPLQLRQSAAVGQDIVAERSLLLIWNLLVQSPLGFGFKFSPLTVCQDPLTGSASDEPRNLHLIGSRHQNEAVKAPPPS